MMKEDNDKLRSLFNQMKLEEPSSDFERALMQKIDYAASQQNEKQKARKKLLFTFWLICAIVAVGGVPSLVFYLFGISFNKLIDFSSIVFDPYIISISSVTLCLLISDTLIRKHINEKNTIEHKKDL